MEQPQCGQQGRVPVLLSGLPARQFFACLGDDGQRRVALGLLGLLGRSLLLGRFGVPRVGISTTGGICMGSAVASFSGSRRS